MTVRRDIAEVARRLPALARRALPLMTPARRAEAEAILAGLARTLNADEDAAFAGYRAQVSMAWESDMQPVAGALAGALHAESEAALRGLRHLLPGLLREVNRRPRTVDPMARAMAHGFYSSFHAEAGELPRTGNAAGIVFSEDPVVTDAMRQWRSREVFETDLGSAELRGFSAHVRNRAVFSARCTNAEFLREVAATVDEVLAGEIGMADGRLRLFRKLKELGYDPAVGFPGEMGVVPPAERDSLQDLSGMRRLDLIIETNVRMAMGFAQHTAGNTESARHDYPAWELVRLYHREVPRGQKLVHGQLRADPANAWQRRWQEAGDAVGWEGAVHSPLVARKDSPIWAALGDGAGGYTDTLLNPFPPFAFRSGMSRRPVPRAQAASYGWADEPVRRTEAKLEPKHREVRRILDGMPADLRAELERELADFQ